MTTNVVFNLLSFLVIEQTLNTMIGDKAGVSFICMDGFMFFFNMVMLTADLSLNFIKKKIYLQC